MFGMQRGHGCVRHREEDVGLQGKQLSRLCPRKIGVAAGYSIFDLEILAEYPPFLLENRFENGGLGLLDDESTDTTRTALSACAMGVGEQCKTDNELPP